MDVAVATLQFISFAVSTLHGCLEAYRFCDATQSIGKDGDLLRTKLSFEGWRLEQWGTKTGLLDAEGDEKSPSDRYNWSMVLDILKQQELLLTSAETLKKRYRLDLPEDFEGLDGPRSPESNEVASILSKLSLRPQHALASAQSIYQQNSPL
jgi:hypothetical protein